MSSVKIDITKGVHTNTKPVNTPPGYYSDALNMRISGQSKCTEEGMVTMPIPTNFVELGNCAIGDQTILLGQIDSKSIIGSLDVNDNWVVEIPPRVVDVLQITEATQVTGRKNWAGERIIYFSTAAGSRRINLDTVLPTDDVEFDKVTSLFLEYDLPKVSYVGENSSGELTSGAYQFAARLVTDSGAATPFGIMSNTIPVIQSSLTSSRPFLTGNPVNTVTTKAIELSIDNIDSSFKYIEIGILTYVGSANTPKITVTNQITLNGQTSVKYTYRGAPDDSDTISIEEFISSGISYLTANYITQKDGALLLGAPEEAAMPDIDWFRVADNITAEYIVKNIPYKESLSFVKVDGDEDQEPSIIETSTPAADNGYSNPATCELYKGYRRNEVYAFTLTPVFISGVLGPTIHIPGQHSISTEAIKTGAAPYNQGTMGTYISEETYPDDRYPSIPAGSGIRLHKFPDTVDQPLVTGNTENNNLNIRVLGVRFNNIVLDASELQYADQIAGYIIGRVNRTGNETQLAQGIIRPNQNIKYNRQNDFTYGTSLGDGTIDWMLSGGDSTNGVLDGGDNSSTCRPYDKKLNDFTFVAPDIIHKLYTADEATHIRQHAIYTSNPYTAPTAYSFNRHPDREEEYSLTKGYFRDITGHDETLTVIPTEIELEGLKVTQGPFGVPKAPHARGGKENTTIIRGSKVLKMCSSDGFVWLHTLNNVNVPYPMTDDHKAVSIAEGGDDRDALYRLKASTTRNPFAIYALTRKNTKQYGPLDQMVSMFTHYQDWESHTGSVEFFNGDTFISKYGLTLNDEGFWPYPTDDQTNEPAAKIGYLKPANASCIVYMWVESNNNYNYRHFIQPTSFSTGNIDGASGSTPFFPAYKQLFNNTVPFGLLTMTGENWQRPGYASQYNNHYSAQPTFKPFAVTPKEDIERKAALLNRIIYSDTSVQGEKSDAYQIFLANNFYDVPQEYGELTDLYVNGELFASTKQIQWKLFFNTMAAQITTVGEMVLGTGGAFNRPAVPMATVDGGYGGTSHWLHAVNTIFGRVFVDKSQGKMFVLTDKLAEFSNDISDMDRLSIKALGDSQILVGSEPLRERVFIKLDNFMWSFNLKHQVFVSKHNYVPRWMFTHGAYIYSNSLANSKGYVPGVYKHSVGEVGMFYGKRHQASITIVANVENTTSKHFQTLEIMSKMVSHLGVSKPFHTFTQLEVWNDERYSGLNTITFKDNAFKMPKILEVLVSKVKDSFRLTVPRDIVIDPEVNIKSVTNLRQLDTDTVPAQWLPKMRGTYVEIKLITDNEVGQLFLYEVLVGLSENIR